MDSNLITAIATVVLSVLTGVYVILSYRILRSSEQSSRESIRPYVIAGLISKELKLVLTIKNTGRRTAHDVKVSFKPEIDARMINSKIGLESINKLMNQASIIPDQIISCALNLNENILHHKDFDVFPKDYIVLVSYYDDSHLPYHEKYTISIGNYFFKSKAMHSDMDYKVMRIMQYLELIQKAITKIADRT